MEKERTEYPQNMAKSTLTSIMVSEQSSKIVHVYGDGNYGITRVHMQNVI
jgi:hypothetical protein